MAGKMITIETESETLLDIDPFLAIRILRGAINDFLGYKEHQQEYQLSRLWLFEDETEGEQDEEFISFYEVCNLLEVNIEKLRIAINMCLDNGKKRLFERELSVLIHQCSNMEL